MRLASRRNNESDKSFDKRTENTADETLGKTTQTSKESAPPKKQKRNKLSQKSLALRAIGDHGIALVPEMGCFLVKGDCSKMYAVTLYPKETCQCPSTGRCYHIISARMATGQEPGPDNKPANLTQLRKNSRARKDKKIRDEKGPKRRCR